MRWHNFDKSINKMLMKNPVREFLAGSLLLNLNDLNGGFLVAE